MSKKNKLLISDEQVRKLLEDPNGPSPAEKLEIIMRLFDPTYGKTDEEIRIEQLEEERDAYKEALEFYENVTRLMMTVRDLPIDPVAGRPIISGLHYQDDGDRARAALARFKKDGKNE